MLNIVELVKIRIPFFWCLDTTDLSRIDRDRMSSSSRKAVWIILFKMIFFFLCTIHYL